MNRVKPILKKKYFQGGHNVKKGLVLVLALALVFVLGIGVALAAPGDYPPDTSSDKYTAKLGESSGKTDTNSWGLDNNIINANRTGVNPDGTDAVAGSSENYNNVIKNVYGQPTHGQYRKNTNSCASCHQTHTAAGKKLLFKNGIYNTCVACHDGTLGFYNVFVPSNAGTFGGDPQAGTNPSVHLATGVMNISAAPGGSRDTNLNASLDASNWGNPWTGDFSCASCHAPHGSYSDRLLHYSPAGVGIRKAEDGGLYIQGAKIYYDSATEKYKPSQDGTAAKVYSGPFLYGYARVSNQYRYWSAIFYDENENGILDWGDNEHIWSGNTTWNQALYVNLKEGYFKDPKGRLQGKDINKLRWNLARPVVAKLQFETIGNTPSGVPIYKATGYQSGITSYCAACHTDYNPTNAQSEYGIYSKAFRHRISQTLKPDMIGEGNSMNCLTCHYAHGTDQSVMFDALGNVKTGEGMGVAEPDANPSSALKRYVNMSVCWKCHTDSRAQALKNNDWFWDTKGVESPDHWTLQNP